MQDFVLHTNHPVAENEHFLASLDEYRRGADQMLLVHIAFNTWNRAAYDRVTREWQALRACIDAPIFAHADHDDGTWEHFVRHLGFQYLTDIACTDGRTRRMFVSRKDVHASEDHPEHPVLGDHEPVVGAGSLPH